MQLTAVNGIEHGTTRFMDVGAVAKAALWDKRRDFWKVAIEFLWLRIPKCKRFPTGGVGNVATMFERQKLPKIGCMRAAIKGFANFTYRKL